MDLNERTRRILAVALGDQEAANELVNTINLATGLAAGSYFQLTDSGTQVIPSGGQTLLNLPAAARNDLGLKLTNDSGQPRLLPIRQESWYLISFVLLVTPTTPVAGGSIVASVGGTGLAPPIGFAGYNTNNLVQGSASGARYLSVGAPLALQVLNNYGDSITITALYLSIVKLQGGN